MVEPRPSKPAMWVRFPSAAPERGRTDKAAAVAQSVEHFLGKEEVTGSNPVSSSKGQDTLEDSQERRAGAETPASAYPSRS